MRDQQLEGPRAAPSGKGIEVQHARRPENDIKGLALTGPRPMSVHPEHHLGPHTVGVK